LGYHLQIPSIGIAGRGTRGMEAREPSRSRGSSTPVWMDGERVGTLLRTREGSAAVYVSAGYRTTLEQAGEIVMQCIRDNRFPEPLVQADRAARRMRKRCERYYDRMRESGLHAERGRPLPDV
ncbi:MAG TPA: endonuclease V, partial [Methanolinea sp.]|nr:endonuclease V [Methanolinea sp.]